MGGWVIRFGKKKFLVLADLMLIIGLCIVFLSQALALFAFGIFVVGAGFSITEASMSAVLADEFPNIAQKHMNFSQAMFSLGAVVGPIKLPIKIPTPNPTAYMIIVRLSRL